MSRYVSIASLAPESHDHYQDVAGSESPLLWDMELPSHVDAERITVNMSRLRVMHAAGAIAASFVEGYEGETEETELSASACLDPFDCSIKTVMGEISLNATFGKAAIVHQLNRPEIAHRAAVHSQDDEVTAEEAYADLYDRAIRGSMRQGTRKHLLDRINRLPGGYRFLSGVSIAAISAAAVDVVVGGPAIAPATLYVMAQASPYASPVERRTRAGQKLEKRWSLAAFGMQPDRYAVVSALSRLPGLVKVAK